MSTCAKLLEEIAGSRMSGRSVYGERRRLRGWTTFSILQARILTAVCHAGSRLLLAGRTTSWPCCLFIRSRSAQLSSHSLVKALEGSCNCVQGPRGRRRCGQACPRDFRWLLGDIFGSIDADERKLHVRRHWNYGRGEDNKDRSGALSTIAVCDTTPDMLNYP